MEQLPFVRLAHWLGVRRRRCSCLGDGGGDQRRVERPTFGQIEGWQLTDHGDGALDVGSSRGSLHVYPHVGFAEWGHVPRPVAFQLPYRRAGTESMPQKPAYPKLKAIPSSSSKPLLIYKR